MSGQSHRWARAIWRLVGGVSLRTKVVGIALAMIILLGLSTSALVHELVTQTLRWELEQRGLSIAHDLANRATDPILTNNLYVLHELMHGVVPANQDVRYAFVLDPRGRLLADSFDSGFPTDLLAANVLPPGESHHVEILQTEEGLIQDIAVPVFEGRAGIARIGMSLNRLTATTQSITRRILLTTVAVSLLGIAISLGLTWLLLRPIMELGDAANRVAGGDLAHRLTPWASDEIGQLQATFNVMVETLDRSRREMEAANEQLWRRNRELSVLYGVSHALSGPLGQEEALERALDRVTALMGAPGGWICILDNDMSCRICTRGPGAPRYRADRACCGECKACRRAIETGEVVIIRPLPEGCPAGATAGDARSASGHVAVPLLVNERVVGLLNLVCAHGSCFDVPDMALLSAVGRQLGLAFENARLWEELRRKEAMRGHLLRKTIAAQEDERRRIARELHDETGQAMTSLLVALKVMEGARTLEQARALAAELRGLVSETLESVRDLAFELRPAALDDLGLVPALRRYVSAQAARFGFRADFVAAGFEDMRLPREIESTLYRIVQEALTNIARHAKATRASVLLERRPDAIVLLIEDDGMGFDPARVMGESATRESLGLYGMEERASLVGGRFMIESSPGAGTTISVEIPLEALWVQPQGTNDLEQPPLSES